MSTVVLGCLNTSSCAHTLITAHCIVSSQLWTDMSHSRTGPLTLRQWHHSIYAAQSSTTYGILTLIHHCLLMSNHFASVWIASIQADHLWTRTPSADSHEAWLSSTVSWPQTNLWHLSLWRKCGECGGRETIGTLKETRCHLESIEVPLMENCI